MKYGSFNRWESPTYAVTFIYSAIPLGSILHKSDRSVAFAVKPGLGIAVREQCKLSRLFADIRKTLNLRCGIVHSSLCETLGLPSDAADVRSQHKLRTRFAGSAVWTMRYSSPKNLKVQLICKTSDRWVWEHAQFCSDLASICVDFESPSG